jgi:glyoxylase-like metal-dependent hydrolase (beta-lactamase superfamily II)
MGSPQPQASGATTTTWTGRFKENVAEQVDLNTITKVVMTHLHFDRAGGLALLPPSVPIFVQRREWEAGHDADAVAKNFFLPLDYSTVAEQVMLLDGDHDLLGDSSIQLLSTPGHTPCHQSVQVGGAVVRPGHDPAVLVPGPVTL